eukprot:COSAG01_NODE_63032_length_281_cov_2.258242_1_plen_30_part_01
MLVVETYTRLRSTQPGGQARSAVQGTFRTI